MQRIVVIGCPGSGKSTFSKALHAASGIPLYHLDMMYWNADKTTVEKTVFLERLSAVLATPAWIIDGNYNSTMKMRFDACDTVFFLDFPLDVCLSGVKERCGKPRTDMPWFESFDDTNGEFIDFIKRFESESKPKIIELLSEISDKNIYVFKSRLDTEKFIKERF